ncbi:MAG: hypothetical protein ABI451_12705 [Dokdonella sp.]
MATTATWSAVLTPGKSGTAHDIKTGKTGHVTITVKQANGERFKTLARNVTGRKLK